MSTNGKMLEIKDVQKVYQQGGIAVHAVKGISLDAHKGDFISIMGPSGSGKSTFMNILGCLDIPTGGIYRLDGIDVSQLDTDELAELRNKKIGFVFQGFNLLPRMSAIENVELPLHYSGSPHPDGLEKAAYALGQVGLELRGDHTPSQMSGGERQRVAIARALINNPSVILADEPTGNLDTKTSYEIMSIFQKLNEEEGITVIMVTHEEDISRFSKRSVVIRDGLLLEDRKVKDRFIAKEMLDKLCCTPSKQQ